MDGDLITIFWKAKSGNPIRQYKYIENKRLETNKIGVNNDCNLPGQKI